MLRGKSRQAAESCLSSRSGWQPRQTLKTKMEHTTRPEFAPDNTPDDIKFRNLIHMLSITREPEIRERLTAQINELRLKMNGVEGRSAIEYRSADKAGVALVTKCSVCDKEFQTDLPDDDPASGLCPECRDAEDDEDEDEDDEDLFYVRMADKAGAKSKPMPTEKEVDDLIWRKQAEIALDDAEFEIKHDGVK